MTKGEETYQKIIDVSIYFFAKDGIHKTSFSKIAEALKMTKPSLYYYVKSKDELIQKVFNYIFEEYSFEAYFEKEQLTKETIQDYLIDGGLQFIHEIEEQDIILNLISEFILYANRMEEKDISYMKKIKESQLSFINGFESVLMIAAENGLVDKQEIRMHAQTLALMLDNIQSYKMLGITIDTNGLWEHTVRRVFMN